jgi:uridine phosphorylase
MPSPLAIVSLIEPALRDEGTSYHYRPPAAFAEADTKLLAFVSPALATCGEVIHRGATWTTDAPFRGTARAIEARQAQGVLAAEMEAAALYAFARARRRFVLCLAHVNNRLGREGDFEKKGADNGVHASLRVIGALAGGCLEFDAVRSSIGDAGRSLVP